MTNAEITYMTRIPHLLGEIVEQLKIANELKALELKEKHTDLIYQIAKIMYN